MLRRPSPRALRFGDFELDIAAYELRRRGRPMRLERLAMDLLILLIDGRDRLVPRGEIVDRLWGRDVFVDVDAGVNTLIRKLRRVLGDAVDHPRFIQTIQGKGYRFVAQVQNDELDARPTRVAIMPFENLTGDPQHEYLSDGLTEETAASLGQILDSSLVTVIGRIWTKAYKGSAKLPAAIGQELAADYLVVGSLRADNQRLHIISNLVRMRDQVQVWSHSYHREPASVLAMQQELGTGRRAGSTNAASTGAPRWPEPTSDAKRRSVRLLPAGPLSLEPAHAANNGACDAGVREGDGDRSRLCAGVLGIADAMTTGPIMGDADPIVARGPARDATTRALKGGDMLAEVQTSAGVEKFFLEWDWSGAEIALRRAIHIDGSYAMAHRLLAVVLSHSRRPDEARLEIARAKVLEPEYTMNHAISAMVEFHAGDMAAAVDHAQRAFAYEPDFWIANYHLGQAYEQQGHNDLALAALAVSTRASRHGNSKPMSVSAYVLARTGRPAEARQVLQAFEERVATRYVPPYATALVHAGFGDADTAFAWLEKAFAARDVHLIFLPVDPKWGALREEPRFHDLLRRCNFLPE